MSAKRNRRREKKLEFLRDDGRDSMGVKSLSVSFPEENRKPPLHYIYSTILDLHIFNGL